MLFHRWVGVVLCLLFLLWFPSGIGMMYFGMPTVTVRDRLERAPTLHADSIVLSPAQAAERAGITVTPAQVRLNSYNGRPVYRLGGGGRGGAATGDLHIIYADTGDEQGIATRALRDRAASAWTGQAVAAARVSDVSEPDQWTVGSQLRSLRPLWKYSWPNGEQVYVGDSGEVLQYTTTGSRLAAYVSAIPHWLYFTPLRKHQPFWIRFTTYAAMVGTAGAIVGMVIGVWLYSPNKRYRHAGQPSRVPYRGQKRLHVIIGLVFGFATVTWTLSGSLAFLPFPASRPTPVARQVQPQAGQRVPGQGGQGARRGGDGGGLAAALRGRTRLADFAETHPRDVIARFPTLGIKELALTSFAGTPLYSATLADGTAKLISLDGYIVDGFDRSRLEAIVRTTAPDPQVVETRMVEEYDYYYLDRTRQRPLPVLLARMRDANGTRYYIDPKSATIVGTYSERNWARRFFYNGLHSLSFPWLYNHRPLWDIVVIVFMVGGTALCVTSLALAWQVLGKRLRRIAGPDTVAAR